MIMRLDTDTQSKRLLSLTRFRHQSCSRLESSYEGLRWLTSVQLALPVYLQQSHLLVIIPFVQDSTLCFHRVLGRAYRVMRDSIDLWCVAFKVLVNLTTKRTSVNWWYKRDKEAMGSFFSWNYTSLSPLLGSCRNSAAPSTPTFLAHSTRNSLQITKEGLC